MFDGDRYKEELNDLALQDLWAWRKFKQIKAFMSGHLKAFQSLFRRSAEASKRS